ncbi:hypothetical protein BDA96_05G025700 [Sorghum bicolor]|jgi:hypothetical protein|uniref:Pectinesterase inhibitor domain-containing protein n=2 Tax=Sorghum bicolor TaxID=4558 RepID=A0A921QVS8_SORBI|nr:hypothetical protein BDA96_05G025700 [Sorghum bicolor]KXG27680.1 hypothetical protein SORBI_3005G025600 [Sorghum bicolor]
MMMRSTNAICLVAFIVVAAAATLTTTTTEAAAASPAAAEFLQGRCSPSVMPKVIARHCYDSLLPEAGSFNGSSIRVIGAATELMVANFRSLLAELRKLNGTKQYKLGKCAEQAAEFEPGPGKKEPEKLAKIRALAAMGDDNKVEYVYDISSWMDEMDMKFSRDCQPEMKAVPDADKLLPTKAVMYPSILVVQGLVSGYTPPRSEMTYP